MHLDPATALSARLAWLRAQPYFAVLTDEDLALIAGRTIARQFSKGEQVFAEGEPCQGLYIVYEGEVRVYKLSGEGREQVLRHFTSGQSFNEVAVFDGGPNPAHVNAVTPCTLWIIPRSLIFDFVRTRPEMAVAVIQNLGKGLRHLVGLIEDLSLRHVSARLAKLLLEAAADGADAHKLTQQEMAARLGTVREMVARALKQLEARGLIETQRDRIVILDRRALEKMV
jgi:CRP/FNR family transcriptional regulator